MYANAPSFRIEHTHYQTLDISLYKTHLIIYPYNTHYATLSSHLPMHVVSRARVIASQNRDPGERFQAVIYVRASQHAFCCSSVVAVGRVRIPGTTEQKKNKITAKQEHCMCTLTRVEAGHTCILNCTHVRLAMQRAVRCKFAYVFAHINTHTHTRVQQQVFHPRCFRFGHGHTHGCMCMCPNAHTEHTSYRVPVQTCNEHASSPCCRCRMMWPNEFCARVRRATTRSSGYHPLHRSHP